MSNASFSDNCHTPYRTGITRRIRAAGLCLVISLLVHLAFLAALRMMTDYRFGPPVGFSHMVTVDLAAAPRPMPPAEENRSPEETSRNSEPVAPSGGVEDAPSGQEDLPAAASRPPASSRLDEEPAAPFRSPGPAAAVPGQLPLKRGMFLAAGSERLVYRIYWLGVPVGSAELEAKGGDREMSIALRIRSNAAISEIFPVDNLIETRHIDGRFIMTSIRQREGDFRSDEMFTVNLAKKRVNWMDRIRGTNLQISVPVEDVMDTLSGMYLLRNRPLQVGRTETLHIFDSEIYAEVPVEVLAREELRLADLRRVETLVVRPLQKTAGMFRRTGDLLIWMTDDADRTPVRIATTVALGRITAELVSAERSEPGDSHSSPGPPP